MAVSVVSEVQMGRSGAQSAAQLSLTWRTGLVGMAAPVPCQPSFLHAHVFLAASVVTLLGKA